MSKVFTLTINSGDGNVELQLYDSDGNQVASNTVQFANLASWQVSALFDLYKYLKEKKLKGTEQVGFMEQLGIVIAEKVLGDGIFRALSRDEFPRTLHIQLPTKVLTASSAEVVAKLTRIPWEFARLSVGRKTLAETNLRVCIEHTKGEAENCLSLAQSGLRILFVYAEACNSSPLAMRQERRAILALFQQKIYPRRKIVAHTIAYGVTRQRLMQQLREHGGYHIVHWSGHGLCHGLELAQVDGKSDFINGDQLRDLFYEAGVALPRFVYLSACDSGYVATIKNWDAFLGESAGAFCSTTTSSLAELNDANQFPSIDFSGTAHSLLRAGVLTVLAMRYSVGDEYAREFALAFYQALLAEQQPKSIAHSVMSARKDLLSNTEKAFTASDHAMPLLYGADQTDLAGAIGRSDALRVVEKHLPRLLETSVNPNFVGRTWQFAQLATSWLPFDCKTPVALITGVRGSGKTAFLAEVLDLFDERFDWILVFHQQSLGDEVNSSPGHTLPTNITLEEFLSTVHKRLMEEPGHYFNHVGNERGAAIFRPVTEDFSGASRLQKLMQNLVRACREQAILLVFDGFETQLKPAFSGDSRHACRDASWDTLLSILQKDLCATRSRILLTSRRPVAVLNTDKVQHLEFAGLSSGEAKLYARQHPNLRKLLFSGDSEQRVLVQRLLNASRFLPALMQELAELCSEVVPSAQLLKRLNALELAVIELELPSVFEVVTQSSQLNDSLLS